MKCGAGFLFSANIANKLTEIFKGFLDKMASVPAGCVSGGEGQSGGIDCVDVFLRSYVQYCFTSIFAVCGSMMPAIFRLNLPSTFSRRVVSPFSEPSNFVNSKTLGRMRSPV